MKVFYAAGHWLFPLYALLFVGVVAVVFLTEFILDRHSRRKHRRSLLAHKRRMTP
ncbi:MAG: hypothetical protein M3O74_13750 [Pseudomonadota bacterium]|nr:hypothetical protein [Pseudomonadota bacterium]